MTLVADRDRMFEVHMENYERNRMYPPRYRKEATMTKLTLDHVSALCRAEGYLHAAITPNMSPNHRKCIEDDLTRLAEVKKHILRYIYEPGLPHGDPSP